MFNGTTTKNEWKEKKRKMRQTFRSMNEICWDLRVHRRQSTPTRYVALPPATCITSSCVQVIRLPCGMSNTCSFVHTNFNRVCIRKMRIRLLMNGNCIGLCEGHFDTLRRSAVLYSIPFKIEMDQSHLVAIFISHSLFSLLSSNTISTSVNTIQLCTCLRVLFWLSENSNIEQCGQVDTWWNETTVDCCRT